MLANNMGWHIFSERVCKMLSRCKNTHDIELLPLPEFVLKKEPRLADYRVLGVKREVKCVKEADSDILWDTTIGKRHILSFRRCVLRANAIMPYDIFLIAEYPVFPVFSYSVGEALADLYPTGFVFERIEAV